MALVLVLSGIPAFIVPSFKHESIHVSREKMTIDSGFWFKPTRDVIELKNLRKLSRSNDEYRLGNLIGDETMTWTFERESAPVQQVVLNDFFSAHSMGRCSLYQRPWLCG